MDALTLALLSSINNALRNGSNMTNANLAFDYLCDELGVEREELPPFDPYWTASLPCRHGEIAPGRDCPGTGPDCAPDGPGGVSSLDSRRTTPDEH